MFIDAKKAHLKPRCGEDIFIELPEECGVAPGVCGKLNLWIYGFGKAAVAWEELYSEKLVEISFKRKDQCTFLWPSMGSISTNC